MFGNRSSAATARLDGLAVEPVVPWPISSRSIDCPRCVPVCKKSCFCPAKGFVSQRMVILR